MDGGDEGGAAFAPAELVGVEAVLVAEVDLGEEGGAFAFGVEGEAEFLEIEEAKFGAAEVGGWGFGGVGARFCRGRRRG